MIIFASPILKKYAAPFFSLTTIIIAGAFVTICLLPWFFAYASGSFWLKENYFLEQPRIVPTNAFVVELVGTRSNNLPLVLSWSSNETYNQIAHSFSRAPITKFWMSDLNNDGIFDEFNYQITMPILATENIYSARVVFEVKVELRSVFRLDMFSLVISDYTFPVPSQNIDIYGDLSIISRSSSYFQAHKDSKDYNYRVLNFTNILGITPDPLSWTNIMRDYHDRDVKTTVQNDYSVWNPSKVSAFVINGHYKIPISRVFYTPGSAEVLKNGWIQYLAYLILVFVIVYSSLWFLFQNRLLSAFTISHFGESLEENTPLKSLIY